MALGPVNDFGENLMQSSGGTIEPLPAKCSTSNEICYAFLGNLVRLAWMSESGFWLPAKKPARFEREGGTSAGLRPISG